MVGGSVPVWLGTVTPLPAGYKVFGAEAGWKIPAGTLIEAVNLLGEDGNNYTNPFAVPCFSYKYDSDLDGYVPCGDYGALVPKAGFSVYKFDANSVNNIRFFGDITAASDQGDGSYAIATNGSGTLGGDIFILPLNSSRDDWNETGVYAYVYNDVVLDKDDENPQATVAAVVAHNEGLLIDRTPCYRFADEDDGISIMEKLVPNVILVRG